MCFACWQGLAVVCNHTSIFAFLSLFFSQLFSNIFLNNLHQSFFMSSFLISFYSIFVSHLWSFFFVSLQRTQIKSIFDLFKDSFIGLTPANFSINSFFTPSFNVFHLSFETFSFESIPFSLYCLLLLATTLLNYSLHF